MNTLSACGDVICTFDVMLVWVAGDVILYNHSRGRMDISSGHAALLPLTHRYF